MREVLSGLIGCALAALSSRREGYSFIQEIFLSQEPVLLPCNPLDGIVILTVGNCNSLTYLVVRVVDDGPLGGEEEVGHDGHGPRHRARGAQGNPAAVDPVDELLLGNVAVLAHYL